MAISISTPSNSIRDSDLDRHLVLDLEEACVAIDVVLDIADRDRPSFIPATTSTAHHVHAARACGRSRRARPADGPGTPAAPGLLEPAPASRVMPGRFMLFPSSAWAKEGKSMNHDPTSHPSTQFPFERLDCYRVLHDALAWVVARKHRLRGLPGDIASHVERALAGALLNVAEACGREGRDRARQMRIALGSVFEAAAGLEAACLFGAIPEDDYAAIRGLLERDAQMLTKLSAR